MMSIRIMTAVWDDKTTKGSERLVLLALADSANDEGFCWPSLETIAQKCNISRRFVITLIESLEAKGLVEREHRGKDGLYTSNMYRVVVHKVVNNSSLPIVNNDTPRSEPPFTGVVNPSSLKPSFNRNVNRNTSIAQTPPPADPETEYEQMIEQKTGYGTKAGERTVVSKWITDGVIIDDLCAALKWMADNERHVYGAGQLDKSVRRAMADRIQAQNTSLPEGAKPNGSGGHRKSAAQLRQEQNAAAFAQVRKDIDDGSFYKNPWGLSDRAGAGVQPDVDADAN